MLRLHLQGYTAALSDCVYSQEQSVIDLCL